MPHPAFYKNEDLYKIFILGSVAAISVFKEFIVKSAIIIW